MAAAVSLFVLLPFLQIRAFSKRLLDLIESLVDQELPCSIDSCCSHWLLRWVRFLLLVRIYASLLFDFFVFELQSFMPMMIWVKYAFELLYLRSYKLIWICQISCLTVRLYFDADDFTDFFVIVYFGCLMVTALIYFVMTTVFVPLSVDLLKTRLWYI